MVGNRVKNLDVSQSFGIRRWGCERKFEAERGDSIKCEDLTGFFELTMSIQAEMFSPKWPSALQHGPRDAKSLLGYPKICAFQRT